MLGEDLSGRFDYLFEPLDDHPAYRQIANVIEQRRVLALDRLRDIVRLPAGKMWKPWRR